MKRPIQDRFWEKVKRGSVDECWPWTAHTHYKGYGVFGIDGYAEKAHRVSWEITNGEIPKGMCVCHKCDNPPCCNPNHLFLGTTGDNTRDSVRKGRFVSTKKGEGHVKHKLTDELVKRFRKLYDGGMSAYAIAKMFPIVTEATMIQVVRRKTWKHIE